MRILGVTGSVGSGKTTCAQILGKRGIPVYDADAQVHRLYQEDPEVIAAITRNFPGVKGLEGQVDRAKLSEFLFENPDSLSILEQIVHPSLCRRREAFLAQCIQQGFPCVVLDVPLLFETGLENTCDFVLVTTASEAVRNDRLQKRYGLDLQKKRTLFSLRQMEDREKQRRADFVLDTGGSLAQLTQALEQILSKILSMKA